MVDKTVNVRKLDDVLEKLHCRQYGKVYNEEYIENVKSDLVEALKCEYGFSEEIAKIIVEKSREKFYNEAECVEICRGFAEVVDKIVNEIAGTIVGAFS